jgi:hypothetical protein
MMDGKVKKMIVDESKKVENIMVVIWNKIGIKKNDEYSIVSEEKEEELEKKNKLGKMKLKRKKEEKESD